MVRLNTRVETIHELLEKLLDDDSDMRDMNLTAKQQEVGVLLYFNTCRPWMSTVRPARDRHVHVHSEVSQE